MSADPQQDQHAVRRERIDEAFKIDEPVHDPRVGPRVVPIIVAVVALVVLIVLFYVAPWG
jgi:chorismate synthase